MNIIKNKIYSLIDNIIKQEDELEKCLHKKDNQIILSNISKNKQRIESLSSLISKETRLSEDKIKILNEEILSLQKEISNINQPNTNFTQKDLDQNLIKEKFINKTLKLHQDELNQIEENLKLLKEEKLASSNELLNLMSLRENYEELIKERSKYIFKSQKIKKSLIDKSENNITEIDLNRLTDNNFDISKTNIEYHDIINIQSINKLSNFLYKIISSNIVSTFSSLLIELNLKNVILSCIENAHNKFMKNNFHYTKNKTNSFIREISVNIVNSDIKISNIFIEPQFEILLKLTFKLFSIEKIINDELKFVNNDYTSNKNILKNKKEIIITKINDCISQKKIIENEKLKIRNDCNMSKNYFDKVQEYKNMINLKKREIQKIQNELLVTQKMYQNQINNLQNANKKLENTYNNIDMKYKIEKINQQIEYLFKGIKTKIKNINDINIKNNFINEMIQDIDKCLDNSEMGGTNLSLKYKDNSNNNLNLNNLRINEDFYSNTSRNYNNIEINDELNKIINSNINSYNEYEISRINKNDEKNFDKNAENDEMSDDFLSSYNSFDDLKQEIKSNKYNLKNNKNSEYQKFMSKNKNNSKNNLKAEKSLNKLVNNNNKGRKSLVMEKSLTPISHKENSFSNKNFNLNHTNYLKLSECLKFSN